MNNTKIDIPFFLISILPISIIIGSSFSLINIVLFGLCFIWIYFSEKNIKIYDSRPVLLLIILYLYLLFNSFNSVDISSGLYRNFGFIRFVFFFLMINYFFLFIKKNRIFLKFGQLSVL